MGSTELPLITSLHALQTLNWDAIETAMREAYADNLIFQDPLFKRKGLDKVLDLYRNMVKSAKAIKIEITETVLDLDEIHLKLTLEFTHKIGLKVKIKNATMIAKLYNHKIVSRKDYWGLFNLRFF